MTGTDLGDRSIEVRRARADIRLRLRSAPTHAASRRAAADVVEDFPPEAARMWVGVLLHACRQERVRVWQLLAWSGIWFESKELGELTDRQRAALVGLLRGQGQ